MLISYKFILNALVYEYNAGLSFSYVEHLKKRGNTFATEK